MGCLSTTSSTLQQKDYARWVLVWISISQMIVDSCETFIAGFAHLKDRKIFQLTRSKFRVYTLKLNGSKLSIFTNNENNLQTKYYYCNDTPFLYFTAAFFRPKDFEKKNSTFCVAEISRSLVNSKLDVFHNFDAFCELSAILISNIFLIQTLPASSSMKNWWLNIEFLIDLSPSSYILSQTEVEQLNRITHEKLFIKSETDFIKSCCYTGCQTYQKHSKIFKVKQSI